MASQALPVNLPGSVGCMGVQTIDLAWVVTPDITIYVYPSKDKGNIASNLCLGGDNVGLSLNIRL
jgi:hypothetical protein